MRRFIALTLLLLIGFTVMAKGVSEKKEVFRIGISKIVVHPALDAIEKGMRDYLDEMGIVATYDVQSANGDVTAAMQIAQKFKSDNVDLALGIATPTTQALANTLKTTPIIFGGITDPLEAAIVPTYEPNDGNVGGISDLSPVYEQIKLFSELTKAKRIGIVFSSGEANGVQLRNLVEEATKKLNLEFVEAGITNSSEVKSALLSITKRIDGLYIGTDNTVVSAIASINEVTSKENIPFFTADPTSAENLDFFMVWGFDYYKHGRKAGEAAYQVLSKQKTAGEIGTVFTTDPKEFELWFNLDVAEKLNITIPQKLLESASVLIKDNKKIVQ
ncbi:MAG: ABC transporter substrate-binding protein [Sphaerochaetaceae bacterium]